MNLHEGGNLARLGYIPDVKQARKITYDLPVKHLEMKEYNGQKIDVLTIGDSFSNEGGGGRNKFYQDYIATINNYTVLNAYPFPAGGDQRNPFPTLEILYNSGYLDKIKPKYVLLESSAIATVPRLLNSFDFKKNKSIVEIDKYYSKLSINYVPPKEYLPFVNIGNLKFLVFKIMYIFSSDAFGLSKVHVHTLNAPLFTSTAPNKLVSLKEDITSDTYNTIENVERVNENLNKIAALLEKKGIIFIYMPIVNKYDLYSEFIINNTNVRKLFFEKLILMKKDYVFVDTKQILVDELRKGENDIFFADDTHWSWKASKKVFEVVKLNAY